MSQDALLISHLVRAFPHRSVKTCLTNSNSTKFCIVEPESDKKCVIKNSDEPGFVVKNPSQKTIHLLVMDHCLFNDQDTKRCDCILFDDIYFCFVELKLNVTKQKQASDKLKEAREQLGQTIEVCKNRLPEPLSKMVLEAYVAMKSHMYPQQSANRSHIFVSFLEQYKVPLFEKAEKDFVNQLNPL